MWVQWNLFFENFPPMSITTDRTSQQHNSATTQQHNNTTAQQHNTTAQQHKRPTTQEHNNTTTQQTNNKTDQQHNGPTAQQHNRPRAERGAGWTVAVRVTGPGSPPHVHSVLLRAVPPAPSDDEEEEALISQRFRSRFLGRVRFGPNVFLSKRRVRSRTSR